MPRDWFHRLLRAEFTTLWSQAGTRGNAIADYLLDGGDRSWPAHSPHAIRRFSGNGVCGATFDVDLPNAIYDWTMSTPLMQTIARLIYFHKRGLWSAQAWRDVFGRDRRVASI
jgi:hypothetical protein